MLGLTHAARRCAIATPRLARCKTSGITRLGTDDPRMSKIVIHGGVVYTSGQTAADAEGIEAQTAACLAKVDDLLAQAGTDKSHALQATIWLKDIASDFKGMNGVSNMRLFTAEATDQDV